METDFLVTRPISISWKSFLPTKLLGGSTHMKRVWFIFALIYATGIVLTGLIVAYSCLINRSLETMRWWFALVLEGGFLLSPVIFVIACVIAGAWGLFSKTPAEEFSVPERIKRIFLLLGILLFLVVPVFLLRDAMFESAARKGSVAKARFWLALGANINSSATQGGNSALTWAIIYGQRDMVTFLLGKKIRFSTNGILSMVPNGHEDIADVLKQHGAVETGARNRQDAYGCKRTPTQHRYANFTNQ
jgi:hypothetical protein